MKSGCGVYRTQRLETSPPLEASAPLDAPAMPTLYALYDRRYPMIAILHLRARAGSVRSQRSGSTNPQTVRTASCEQNRRKAGEVTIGKHVETETARVSVPVEKTSCD